VVPVGAETLANGRVASLKAEVRWARANGGIEGEGSAAARGLGLLMHE
jgi:hypothetical protein